MSGTSTYQPISFTAVADEAIGVFTFSDSLAHDEYATLAQGYAQTFAFWGGGKALDFITAHEASIAARMSRVPALAIYPAAACQLALVLSDLAHPTDNALWTLRGSLLPDGTDDLGSFGGSVSSSYIGFAVRVNQLVLLALYNRPMLELVVDMRPLGAWSALED